MMRHRRPGKLAVVTTALAVAAVGLAACSSSSPPSATSGSTSPPARMVKVPGGTMTIAEQPGAGPNYVFPMMSSAYFTTCRTSSWST